uniref:Uncharacterized protein n=1 Tax=Romanomermis culicivorax TaxID=13658 RepID=A0A915JQL5_ROMCU
MENIITDLIVSLLSTTAVLLDVLLLKAIISNKRLKTHFYVVYGAYTFNGAIGASGYLIGGTFLYVSSISADWMPEFITINQMAQYMSIFFTLDKLSEPAYTMLKLNWAKKFCKSLFRRHHQPAVSTTMGMISQSRCQEQATTICMDDYYEICQLKRLSILFHY